MQSSTLTLLPAHGAPALAAMDERDLYQVARFLAQEFGHSTAVACTHGALWYREQLGADAISLEHAAFLRTMTINCCMAATDERIARFARRRDRILAKRYARQLAHHGATAVILAFLVWCLTIGLATLVNGRGVPIVPFQADTPAQVDEVQQ